MSAVAPCNSGIFFFTSVLSGAGCQTRRMATAASHVAADRKMGPLSYNSTGPERF
jgi:hypothetical protein